MLGLVGIYTSMGWDGNISNECGTEARTKTKQTIDCLDVKELRLIVVQTDEKAIRNGQALDLLVTTIPFGLRTVPATTRRLLPETLSLSISIPCANSQTECHQFITRSADT